MMRLALATVGCLLLLAGCAAVPVIEVPVSSASSDAARLAAEIETLEKQLAAAERLLGVERRKPCPAFWVGPCMLWPQPKACDCDEGPFFRLRDR
jgi:hypothetical protein